MVDKNRKLVLALLDNRMNQRDLARAAGIHETRVSLIVNGRFIPSQKEADLIAGALKKDAGDLFKQVA